MVASRLRERFMTPRNLPPRDWELPLLTSAERITLRFGLSALRWGSGPTVLLMHGWEGRPTQFAELIKARAHFVRLVEEKAGLPAKQIDVARYQLDMPGLIVHAADDPMVPVEEAQVIHRAWFDSQLLQLEQGGHQRLLADPRLIGETLRLLDCVGQRAPVPLLA